MTTHYLITNAKQAIGVTATSEADAMDQARKMGISEIIVRVDVAMSKEEWDAATAPAKTMRTTFTPERLADTQYYAGLAAVHTESAINMMDWLKDHEPGSYSHYRILRALREHQLEARKCYMAVAELRELEGNYIP